MAKAMPALKATVPGNKETRIILKLKDRAAPSNAMAVATDPMISEVHATVRINRITNASTVTKPVQMASSPSMMGISTYGGNGFRTGWANTVVSKLTAGAI